MDQMKNRPFFVLRYSSGQEANMKYLVIIRDANEVKIQVLASNQFRLALKDITDTAALLSFEIEDVVLGANNPSQIQYRMERVLSQYFGHGHWTPVKLSKSPKGEDAVPTLFVVKKSGCVNYIATTSPVDIRVEVVDMDVDGDHCFAEDARRSNAEKEMKIQGLTRIW